MDCAANVLCHGPKWALWRSAVSWTKECVQYRGVLSSYYRKLCCEADVGILSVPCGDDYDSYESVFIMKL